MLKDQIARPSNRSLVLRFAAFLAHLLDEHDGAGVVHVQTFAIYKKIMAALEARELANERGRYDALIGKGLLGPGVRADEAAEAYFEQVLQRPLYLARDQHVHKGHELFLALCRRGSQTSWQTARLVRGFDVGGARRDDLSSDMRGVFARLARLDCGISEGNPATSTRALHGALHLQVAGRQAMVAEEMSVWEAICCAPSRLGPLQRGAELHGFCSVVIKAVETANAHYGTLLSLGLSPRDWRDLSLNTAKKTSAFLSKVREQARIAKAGPQTLAVWQAAWTQQQVPGYASAEALWGSELGQALRSPHIPAWVEEQTEAAVASREDKVLDAVSYERMLTLAQNAGIIRPCDAHVLVELYLDRTTIEEIASGPSFQELLGSDAKPSRRAVVEHLRKLVARIRRHSDEAEKLHMDARQPSSIPILAKDRLSAE